MRLNTLAVASVLVLGVTSAHADDLMQRAQATFKVIPSAVPAVKENPITREKIELGKMLFFEPRLSASEIISCNTCHNLGTGGVDAGPTSTGHGWQKGPRRAPTVLQCRIQRGPVLGRPCGGPEGTGQGAGAGRASR